MPSRELFAVTTLETFGGGGGGGQRCRRAAAGGATSLSLSLRLRHFDSCLVVSTWRKKEPAPRRGAAACRTLPLALSPLAQQLA